MSWPAPDRGPERTPRPPRPRRRALWVAVGLAALAPAPLPIGLAVLSGVAVPAAAVVVTRRALARRRARRAQRDPQLIFLGSDPRGRPVSLHQGQLSAHGLIVGASGSGKSTTLLGIAGQQITRGQPLVAIDLKGSPEFAAALGDASARTGRRLRVWTPDGPEHWNPLAHGNPTQLKDRLISTERFTEPHYQRAAERYVQTALQVLTELEPGAEASLARVVALLDPKRLEAASRRLPTARGAAVRDYVKSLSPDQLSAVRGLQSRLAVVSESHTGAFLEPAAGAIDLRRGLDGAEVTLFSLNSSSYGQLSAQLGAMALQDLVSAAGERERRGAAASGPPALVAIDEFSALGADNVTALIARGRSAGVSVLLSTQELADLDRVARGFREQVVGSTAVKIAHRQDVPESAREVARMAGTTKAWEQTYSQADGWRAGAGLSGRNHARVNSRLTDRFNVEPATVQSLRTGEAVVITKTPSAQTRLARIRPLRLGTQQTRGERER